MLARPCICASCVRVTPGMDYTSSHDMKKLSGGTRKTWSAPSQTTTPDSQLFAVAIIFWVMVRLPSIVAIPCQLGSASVHGCPGWRRGRRMDGRRLQPGWRAHGRGVCGCCVSGWPRISNLQRPGATTVMISGEPAAAYACVRTCVCTGHGRGARPDVYVYSCGNTLRDSI